MDGASERRGIWELTGERVRLEDELSRLQEHQPWSQAVAALQVRLEQLCIEIERTGWTVTPDA